MVPAFFVFKGTSFCFKNSKCRKLFYSRSRLQASGRGLWGFAGAHHPKKKLPSGFQQPKGRFHSRSGN